MNQHLRRTLKSAGSPNWEKATPNQESAPPGYASTKNLEHTEKQFILPPTSQVLVSTFEGGGEIRHDFQEGFPY